MSNSLSRIFAGIAASFLANTVRAQCLDWSPVFTSNGTTGLVEAQGVFDDGNGPALYVVGSFDTVAGVPATNIAKWNGSSWSALGSGISGFPQALAVYDDGHGAALYVAGSFSDVAGTPAANIARWDGTSWSALGTGTDQSVHALCVYDDGGGAVLCVAGEFTHAGNAIVANVAKWNGGHWSGMGAGLAGYVVSLGAFDSPTGPELIAGGSFPQVNGVPSGGVARWDGSTWSPMGSGTDNQAVALQQYDDGSGNALYAVGDFTHAGGNPANHIARWDGSSWSALGAGVGGIARCLGVFDGGSGLELVVGGSFATVGGVAVNSIARWNGSAWSALGAGLDPGGPTSLALSMVASSSLGGPTLFVGGTFSHAGSVSAKRLARWNGSSWSSVGASGDNTINDPVERLTVFDDGGGPALFATGYFTQAGGQPAHSIARWNGSSWSALAGGLETDPGALCVFDDGGGAKLYVAESIDHGAFSPRILTWDGTSWSTLPGNPVADNNIYALCVFDDGSGPALYLGGDFTSVNGVPAARVAKWNGATFSALGSGIGGISPFVWAMAVHDDGSGPALFVGGSFSTAGGHPAGNIAKWDGAAWSPLAGGVNNNVLTLASFDDGSGSALYAGGQFDIADFVLVHRAARWRNSAWSALGGGMDDSVNALCIFDDGSGAALHAGGRFSTASGAPANGLARWNGTTWTELGGGVGGGSPTYVNALAVYDDGAGGGADLYVGGYFDHAGTTGSWNMAEWRGCGGAIAPFCAGDGSSVACPCANQGLPGRGCQNSAATGGALLGTSGTTQPDTIVLHASHELPSVLSTFLQGDAPILATPFGDGLRCAGGTLKRLYVKNASGGSVDAPTAGEPSITARSAALGDPITPGTTRYYQTYYRDPNLAFCSAPAGNSWNVTNGVKISW